MKTYQSMLLGAALMLLIVSIAANVYQYQIGLGRVAQVMEVLE